MDPKLKKSLLEGQKLLTDPTTTTEEVNMITQAILLTTILSELQEIKQLLAAKKE